MEKSLVVCESKIEWYKTEIVEPIMDIPLLLYFPRNKEMFRGTYTQRHYFRAYKSEWVYHKEEIEYWAYLPNAPTSD